MTKTKALSRREKEKAAHDETDGGALVLVDGQGKMNAEIETGVAAVNRRIAVSR